MDRKTRTLAGMRLTVLASGSSGNAALLQGEGTHIIIDAGIGIRKLKSLVRELVPAHANITAVVVTHAHGDHAQHAFCYAHHLNAPLYMTEATQRRLRADRDVEVRIFGPSAAFQIGHIRVLPFPIPHDAPQVALVFAHRQSKIALITDLGHIPRGLSEHVRDCHTVFVESNYDPDLLAAGPYPPSLKNRILSNYGHLANAQTAAFLHTLSARTQRVVLMHLSQTNNSPDIALGSAQSALHGRGITIDVCSPERLPCTYSVPTQHSRVRHAERQLALTFM